MKVNNAAECDVCSKFTKDYTKEVGWLNINGDQPQAIKIIRDTDVKGETASYNLVLLIKNNHFCSGKCLIAFLTKRIQEICYKENFNYIDLTTIEESYILIQNYLKGINE